MSKNFWSSAEIINLINYFCCNLYCVILLLCYAQYLILETVVLTFVYCIILCLFCVCGVFFLTSFMSDCYVTEFVDLQNGMCVYVCICTYSSICMEVFPEDSSDFLTNIFYISLISLKHALSFLSFLIYLF